jgi:hypothetical protein
MKKYSREDQRLMAAWAADCAGRVLPFFEEAYPGDRRPRDAIETCRSWVRTGVFAMAAIRGASLSAHAAARDARENKPASFAARAAGHAMATAHVPQHAWGGAYYALKAFAAADPALSGEALARELERLSQDLPEHLRQELRERILVQTGTRGCTIRLQKGRDF